MSRVLRLLAILVLVISISGCTGPKPLKPGRASIPVEGRGSSADGQQQISQPENPAQASSQTRHETNAFEVVIPAGSTIKQTTAAPAPDGRTNTSTLEITVSEPTRLSQQRASSATQNIGAAQKDTARELGAKLAATRPATWVGIALIVAGAALLYFGWYTPAMIAGGVGLGLMLFAQLVATHSVLLLILALTIGAIYLVHHAYNKGQLDAILPDALDKNPKPKDKP